LIYLAFLKASFMTPRNLAMMLLAASACAVCAVKANQSRYIGILNEALHIVSSEYVRPVKEKDLFERAMDGMLTELDDNSSFIPESEYERFEEDITNEFGGIGVMAHYDEAKKKLYVTSPMPETPALRAGLKPLDEIVSIDGKRVTELGEAVARKSLRGAPGSRVKLNVLSEGATSPHEVVVIRDIITSQTVLGDTLRKNGEWDFRLADHPDIAYIRILSFGDGTAEGVEKALEFGGQRPRGVILDLRDNPGGLLDSATEICDMFLKDGVIVCTRGREGVLLETHKATSGNEIDDQIPVVVMVDGESASASEIVAACLQDHHRGKVVGQKSYGKGSVQNVIPLQSGRSALRLTIASYWRPSGKNIQRPKEGKEPETAIWGVSPDFGWDVPVTREEKVKTILKRYERDTAEYQHYSSKSPVRKVNRGNLLEDDSQLKKAVECIDSWEKK
jgi:carboxyl-terminal processing protease